MKNKFMDAYSAYSGSHMNRPDINVGNKSIFHLDLVILPPEALERLTRLNAESPMVFRITVAATKGKVFCGVLEFTADHNACYLPDWMKDYLRIKEGENIIITNVKMPKANYMKVQPFLKEFTLIPNYKAA